MGEIRGKATDGIVARYINRRLSTAMTLAIVKRGLPVTPNRVSVVSFALGMLAAASYPLGYPALGGILAQVSSVVDGVDGELARALGMESKVGAFVDSILDRIADVAIILGVAFCVLRAAPNPMTVLAAASALSGSLLVSYVHARGEASLGVHPVVLGRFPSIASRDVRLFIVFLGSVAGFLVETLLVLSTLTYTYVIAKLVEVALHRRELTG